MKADPNTLLLLEIRHNLRKLFDAYAEDRETTRRALIDIRAALDTRAAFDELRQRSDDDACMRIAMSAALLAQPDAIREMPSVVAPRSHTNRKARAVKRIARRT